MDVGNAAWASEPQWIGRTPHEPLAPNDEAAGTRPRPVLRAACGLRTRRTRNRAALAGRRTGVSGPDPAAGHRHPAAVPHHQHVRGTRGGRHHRDRARRTLPAPPVPGGLLPVRHRRGQRALLPVVCDAPPRTRARLACPSSNTCWWPRPSRRAGRCRCPTTRAPTGSGAHPASPVTACSTASARPWATSALGLSPDAPVGLWGYSGGGLATAWAAEECGEYAPELNIVGAVLGSPVGDLGHTFRRLNGTFYSGLPATVVAALSHVYPDLDRVIQRARHRRGQGAAGPARADDHRARRAAPGGDGHGRPGRLPLGGTPGHAPRSSTCSTRSSWAPRPRARRC